MNECVDCLGEGSKGVSADESGGSECHFLFEIFMGKKVKEKWFTVGLSSF